MNTVSLADLAPSGREPVFESPYTVALGLEAGETIPEHRHAGQDTAFVVHSGALDLSVGDERGSLGAGDAATFDGSNNISVSAQQDTEAFVVFSDRD